jgi:predicted secreted protein
MLTKSLSSNSSSEIQPAPSGVESAQTAPASRRAIIIGASVAAILFLVIYLARLDHAVGLFVDDAWYVLLAQALATGHGYQLINSPSPGILPTYPPGYPFLLSLAYRLRPSFPDNLLLLKSVSVLAMLGVGWASWRHFRRDREWPQWLALVSALTVALAPSLVFLATSSAMSECVYMAFQLLAVVAVETCARAEQDKRGWRYALLAGALAVAAFLTRSIGVAVIGAGLLYLLKERRWRSAAVFAGTVVLLAAPWMLYARLHAPTPAQRNEQGGMIVQPYDVQLWQRRAGDVTRGMISIGEMPERMWNNTLMMIGNNPARLFLPVFYRSTKLSGEEVLETSTETKLLAWLLSLLIVPGFVLTVRRKVTSAELLVVFTFLIASVWSWDPYRFVLPLAPFLLFYLLETLRAIYELAQRRLQLKSPAPPWKALTAVVGLLLVCYLADHAGYWYQRNDLTPAEYLPWRALFEENKAELDWLREKALPDTVIVSENPALVYLYAGHKSMAGERIEEKWEDWKRLNVRYLAHLSIYQVPDPGLSDGRFNQAYRSKGLLKLRVVDFGPKENRKPWNVFAPAGQIKIDKFN